MRLLLTFGLLVALAVPGAPADAQVMRCTENMPPIADERLQAALDLLKTTYPSIEFPVDERPCTHAAAVVATLHATLSQNYLKNAVGYEFAKIVNGDTYFTVERFRIDSPKRLRGVTRTMNADQSRKLRTKANTVYDYFVADNTIVIMISDASGRARNAELFRQVRQSFDASAPPAKPKQ